jgi:hypothetical protein
MTRVSRHREMVRRHLLLGGERQRVPHLRPLGLQPEGGQPRLDLAAPPASLGFFANAQGHERPVLVDVGDGLRVQRRALQQVVDTAQLGQDVPDLVVGGGGDEVGADPPAPRALTPQRGEGGVVAVSQHPPRCVPAVADTDGDPPAVTSVEVAEEDEGAVARGEPAVGVVDGVVGGACCGEGDEGTRLEGHGFLSLVDCHNL